MTVDIWQFTNGGVSLGPMQYDSATHEEDLDGTDKLTVVSKSDPQKRDRFVWQDASGTWHEHMVDSTRRVHSDAKPRTESTCSNSISELFGAYASGTVIKASVQLIVSTLLANTRWTAGTCDDFGIVEIEVWHKNVRECLSELCEIVSGELDTVITVGASGVATRTVRIVRQRGSNLAAREFSYGVNASGIKREVGPDEVYTAIIGYGAKVDSTDHSDYAQRISVTLQSGIDKATWGIPNGDGTFADNYTTYTDNACTSEAFLAKQCRIMLNSVSTPLIRYEFDTVQVDDKLWADVTLGTVVLCTDGGFNPPLQLRERVSHIRRELGGRINARIAIGSRTNPMVERFKSSERIARRTTGNSSRFSRPGFTRGNYGDDYQAEPVTTLPAYIAVDTPPTKTEYLPGETFDFSGIVVKMYDENDELYTDSWYIDGIIPFEELSFDPTEAPENVQVAGIYNDELEDNSVIISYISPDGTPREETIGPTGLGYFGKPNILMYAVGDPWEDSQGRIRRNIGIVVYGYNYPHSPTPNTYRTVVSSGLSIKDGTDFSFQCGNYFVIYRYASSDDFENPNDDDAMPNAISSMQYGIVPVTITHGTTNLTTTTTMKADATWSGSGGGDF